MKISQRGIELVKHFESLRPKAYKCPAGILTICYGHTNAQGRKFKAGDTWTKEECEQALADDLAVFEQAVLKHVKVPLTQHQFDALVSFVYNVGEGNFAKSTLLKKLNAGDYEGAAKEFHRWNKASGKTLAGLTRRRATEALLFQDILDANYDGRADVAFAPMPHKIDPPGKEHR